jgi:hypothetical protein
MYCIPNNVQHCASGGERETATCDDLYTVTSRTNYGTMHVFLLFAAASSVKQKTIVLRAVVGTIIYSCVYAATCTVHVACKVSAL